MGVQRRALLFVTLLASGCLESGATRCGDLLCPPGLVCVAGQRCGRPVDVAACAELAEGAACKLSEGAGVCHGGVCGAVICGDGRVDGDEVCDDGNRVSCDGCSSECDSDESCGNARVECAEQCDDGTANSSAPNASCRLDCRRQRCGDGVVDDRSGEDCDGAAPASRTCRSLGFYGGELGCSSACRPDVATCAGTCGDGVVQEAELCDGLPPRESCLDYGYSVGNLYCSGLCTPRFNTCERMGFSAMPVASSTGFYLETVWASADGSAAFAAGYGGLVLHWDGSSWVRMPSATTDTLLGVGGTSGSDVYAVGKNGSIVHFDGTQWAAQPSGTTVQLNAVWAVSPQDVWAVGRSATVLHSTGTGTWTEVATPLVSRGLSVWASGSADVFISGLAEIVHFDGTTWTSMALPQEVLDGVLYVYSLWGSAPDDVFAVGEGGLILHYDGVAWTRMSSGTSVFLNAVAGSGPRDVYAAGVDGVVLHWDGLAWSPLPSGVTQEIFAVALRGVEPIIAGPGVLQSLAPGVPVIVVTQSPTTDKLTAVWALGPSEALVASAYGEIYRYDGSSWTPLPTPGGTDAVWSMWGASRTDVFAVGENGSILHFDGSGWTAQVSGTTESLNWVWGSGGADVYAAGSAGTLLHFDGTNWSPVATNVSEFLYAVWGSGPRDVFVVGGGGTVLHFDGLAWQSLDTGTTSEFWGVWGASGQVFLFGDADGVLRFDGTRFLPATVPARRSFNYGVGTSRDDVFAIEFQGQGLVHHDGSDWAQIALPSVTTFNLAVSRERVWVSCDQGKLLTVDRRCTAHETRCGDRWDNDCDGQLNCADDDCASSAECLRGGRCEATAAATCDAVLLGDTTGGSPRLEAYGCELRAEVGRERVFRFDAPRTGPVTVELVSAVAELDVLVLGSYASGACDPEARCLAASSATPESRRLTFAAEAGKTYWLVVDAASAAAAGPFELHVGCP